MRDIILPRMVSHFDQVVVVGEYVAGSDYEYVHSPSRFFDCRDVLAQRQAGFETAVHDTILFQMDDHVVSEKFAAELPSYGTSWDVLSPARHSMHDGRLLNSGWNDERPMFRENNYIHTHVIVVKRSAIESCPWNALPLIRAFDVAHTQNFRDLALRVEIARQLIVYDLEE